MIKRRRRGGLEKLDSARSNRMIEGLKAFSGDAYSSAFDALADPGRRELDSFTDEELAELIAREPSSKQGHLASSILRSRESWRTPARWALVFSGLSLMVAMAAFARTL